MGKSQNPQQVGLARSRMGRKRAKDMVWSNKEGSRRRRSDSTCNLSAHRIGYESCVPSRNTPSIPFPFPTFGYWFRLSDTNSSQQPTTKITLYWRSIAWRLLYSTPVSTFKRSRPFTLNISAIVVKARNLVLYQPLSWPPLVVELRTYQDLRTTI